MKKTGKRIGIIFAVIIGIVLAAVLALLTVLTVTEYKPADVEKVSGFGRAKKRDKNRQQHRCHLMEHRLRRSG